MQQAMKRHRSKYSRHKVVDVLEDDLKLDEARLVQEATSDSSKRATKGNQRIQGWRRILAEIFNETANY